MAINSPGTHRLPKTANGTSAGDSGDTELVGSRGAPAPPAAFIPADIGSFPVQTRMLLYSDGSTTTLLEAMIGLNLQVTVVAQRACDHASLEPAAQAAIPATPPDEVVLRESVLHAGGSPVSVNRVVFVASTAPWLARRVDDMPIGHQLNSQGTLQQRTLLAVGTDFYPWSARRCAFKAYVIRTERGQIYVHERFHPDVVPVA